MNEILFNAINYSATVRNINFLVYFYIFILLANISIFLNWEKIIVGINKTKNIEKREFISNLMNILKEFFLILLFPISIILLLPGIVLLLKNSFNLLTMTSLFLNLLIFMLNFLNFILIKRKYDINNIILILLIISLILFLLGKFIIFF